MIKFFPDQRVVVMDLVDLEHCGFDHDEFVGELHLSGIDDENAKFPLAIVVNVAGGHVITPDTRQETVEAAMEARRRFDETFEFGKKAHALIREPLGSNEEKVACVFCEEECKPAPTERGWIDLQHGKGIHFECLDHLWESAQRMRRVKDPERMLEELRGEPLEKRVWKPMDVEEGLRLYGVRREFPNHPEWNELLVVAAKNPRGAASLIGKIYERVEWIEEPTIWGHALNVLQPARWWDDGAQTLRDALFGWSRAKVHFLAQDQNFGENSVEANEAFREFVKAETNLFQIVLRMDRD